MLGAALLAGLPDEPGLDTAAHAYKVELVRDGEPLLWDGMWYCGTYGAATYGLLYYLVAAVTGEAVLVILAAGFLPLLFHLYQRRMWGLAAVVPAAVLAVDLMIKIAGGMDAFIVGLALVMGGAALLAARRASLAALPVGAALFVNPIAVLVVGVLLVADLIARPERRRDFLRFGIVLAPFLVVWLFLLLAFHLPGDEPQPLWAQAVYIALALAGFAVARTSADPERRARQTTWLVALAALLVVLVVPGDPVGLSMGRFEVLFGVPLLLCTRRPRWALLAPVLALFLVVVFPHGALRAHYLDKVPTRAEWEAFNAPAVDAARTLYDPDYRFHVVLEDRHWDAYSFPLASYPIARGWYRQSDTLHSEILATDFTAEEYVAWLRDLGVNYVFLPHTKLEEPGKREGKAIKSTPDLRVADELPGWTIYEVVGSLPLTLPADEDGKAISERLIGRVRIAFPHVIRYRRDQIELTVPQPGDYVVKLTYNPYWTLEEGEGTLSEAPGLWLHLRADGSGTYVIRFAPTWSKVLRAALPGGP